MRRMAFKGLRVGEKRHDFKKINEKAIFQSMTKSLIHFSSTSILYTEINS